MAVALNETGSDNRDAPWASASDLAERYGLAEGAIARLLDSLSAMPLGPGRVARAHAAGGPPLGSYLARGRERGDGPSRTGVVILREGRLVVRHVVLGAASVAPERAAEPEALGPHWQEFIRFLVRKAIAECVATT